MYDAPSKDKYKLVLHQGSLTLEISGEELGKPIVFGRKSGFEGTILSYGKNEHAFDFTKEFSITIIKI